MVGRYEQRRPCCIRGGVVIAVQVCELNRSDGPPELVMILGFPADDDGIGHRDIHRGEHARLFEQGQVVPFGKLNRRPVPEPGGIPGPKHGEQRLVRGAGCAVEAAHEFGFIDVVRIWNGVQRWRASRPVRYGRGNRPRRHIGELGTGTGQESGRRGAPFADFRAAEVRRRRRCEMIPGAPRPNFISYMPAPRETSQNRFAKFSIFIAEVEQRCGELSIKGGLLRRIEQHQDVMRGLHDGRPRRRARRSFRRHVYRCVALINSVDRVEDRRLNHRGHTRADEWCGFRGEDRRERVFIPIGDFVRMGARQRHDCGDADAGLDEPANFSNLNFHAFAFVHC